MNAPAPAHYYATQVLTVGAGLWQSFHCKADYRMNERQVLRDLFSMLPLEADGWSKNGATALPLRTKDGFTYWRVSRA